MYNEFVPGDSEIGESLKYIVVQTVHVVNTVHVWVWIDVVTLYPYSVVTRDVVRLSLIHI